MIKNITVSLLLLVSFSIQAQLYKNYDWTENPSLHTLNDEEQKESSVGIFEKHIIEYVPKLLDVKVYETKHTLAHVLDDKGIAQHNTVYIPMYEVKNVVGIKARTISPDGSITMLDENNIKEVENVEEYGDFKIFAIEGAEKGSEIEVLYTVQKEFDMYGSKQLQFDYPIREASVTFVNNDLNHRLKAYRTDQQFQEVQIGDAIVKRLSLTNVPAMIEEEYATPNANKIAVVYQCFPKGQDITNEMFWNNVTQNIGGSFFPSKVPKIISDDLEKVLTEVATTNFKKLMLLDEYVKTNFNVVQNNNPELTNIDYIVKNRTASDFGILKAYAFYLAAMNIDYEIVLTANRFQLKFDPEFFMPNMLRDFLIYIPSEKKYIAPDRVEYRFGEAPFNILGNQGLFINSNLSYRFAEIAQEDPEFSRIKRITDISFDEDMQFAEIALDQEYYGHWSATNRAVLNWYTGEDLEDFKDYLTGSGIEDKVTKEYSTENEAMMQLEYNAPFKVSSVITTESLLEEAGEFYIFNVGQVIGTQSELYQEKERLNPIEMQYPNRYNYTITVNIPEGYEAEGLESLQIDKSYKNDAGEKLAKFESDYELQDNKIVITIEEFYKVNTYDMNRYEEFRTVINAASDFNKASVLLKEIE